MRIPGTPPVAVVLTLALAGTWLINAATPKLEMKPSPWQRIPLAFSHVASPMHQLGSRATQQLSQEGNDHVNTFRWTNFNGQSLSATLRVNRDDARKSADEWGIPTEKLDKAARVNEQAIQSFYDGRNDRDKEIVSHRNVEAQLAVNRLNERRKAAVDQYNKALKDQLFTDAQASAAGIELDESLLTFQHDYDQRIMNLDAELARDRHNNDAKLEYNLQSNTSRRDQEIRDIYQHACLNLDNQELRINYARLIQQDAPRLARASGSLFQTLSGACGTLEAVQDAALAMVTTALSYQVPPDQVNGRDSLGLLPPAACLACGWGDCDSKSVLLASLMSGWKSTSGPSTSCLCVLIPEHCLIAVRRIPTHGQHYVEFNGESYVLMEPAGPGALPAGEIGESTTQYLTAGGEFELFKIY